MGEKSSHKATKQKAAGKSGKTEIRIKGGRRIDAETKNKATEVERGGPARLKAAARRLKDSGKRQKVLAVPQQKMGEARKAMQAVGVSGTVRNLKGSKRLSVPK